MTYLQVAFLALLVFRDRPQMVEISEIVTSVRSQKAGFET